MNEIFKCGRCRARNETGLKVIRAKCGRCHALNVLKEQTNPLQSEQANKCKENELNGCIYLSWYNSQAHCLYRSAGAVHGAIPKNCPLGFKSERSARQSNGPGPDQLLYTPVAKPRVFIDPFLGGDVPNFPQVKAAKTDAMGYGESLQTSHPPSVTLARLNDQKPEVLRYPFSTDRCPKCGNVGLTLFNSEIPGRTRKWQCSFCRALFEEEFISEEVQNHNQILAHRDKPIPNTSGGAQETVLEVVKSVKSSDFKHGTDPDEKFDPEQLKRGIAVEMEHTNDPEIAKAIAKAHLSESPDYYIFLEEMENQMPKEKESLANMHNLMEEQPSGRAVTLPEWSPKAAVADYTADDRRRIKLPPNTNITYQPSSYHEPVTGLNTGLIKERCPFCYSTNITNVTEDDGQLLPHSWHCNDCGLDWQDRLTYYNTTKPPLATPLGVPGTYEETKAVKEETVRTWIGWDIIPLIAYVQAFIKSKDYLQILREYFQEELSNQEINLVRNILFDGMSGGKSINFIKYGIGKIIEDNERAEVIARTETIRISNRARADQAEEKGEKKMKFMASPNDGRRCELCAKLDGKILSIREAKNFIPEKTHPQCRCSLAYVI